MSSLTKKILFSLMITLSSILMATTFVRASISFPNGYEDLKNSNTYYCMEHQDGFSAGTWDAIYSQTIRSDDPERNNRTLAKILYDGIVSGQGGYHQDHGGPYQYAIWKWCYVNGINTRQVDSAIYDQAYAAVENPTTYTEAGKAAISLVENQMTVNGMVGSVKIKSLTGSISGINITWKDIASNDSNNNQTKTIDANSSSIPGWIELYKDEKCTQPIKVGEIKQNDTIYFKNLQPNYWMKQINFSATARSSGYTVTWIRWRKNNSQVSEQDLMSATKSEGVETNASVSISTNYSYGKIKIKKVGVYTKDGEEKKTSKIKATFKLYCTTLNKWVSGTATGRKTYVDDFNKASEYTSTITVKQLHSTYQYQLVEVKVDNEDYNNPIKMVSAISNLQKDLKVTKNGEYYSTSNVIVYANKTNEVVVRDEKTSYNLTIKKVEKNNKNKKIKDVSFLIYGANNGWVKGTDGNYTYSKEIDKINDYKYTTDENGQIKLASLKKDTYYVYEIFAPKDYNLKEQEGYMKDPKGHIAGLNNKVSEWSYCGDTKLTENVAFNIENERTSGNLTIIKEDEDTKERIEGVEVKVYYKDGGWIIKDKDEYAYTYTNDMNKATPFVTDSKGEVRLENLLLGEYTIIETKPKEGYLLKDQGEDKYMKDPNKYIENSKNKPAEWVYLGIAPLDEENNKNKNYEFVFDAKNRRKLNINGCVWLDVTNEKLEPYNYIYDSDKDKLLSGIEVRLCDINNNERTIAEDETDENGFYEFKDISYLDAENAYVEFIYDDEKYIVVDTLVGDNNAINSKAKEYTMTTDKLNDQKIIDERIKGNAITEKKQKNLISYMSYDTDSKRYVIKDINLGLIPKVDPNISVYEKLDYIKIELNDFTYTYTYDEPPITADPYVPKASSANPVSKMLISPTDIAYNKIEENKGKLNIYVVYQIDVKNNFTDNKNDDIYIEKKLYLTELINKFDSDWYELSDAPIGRNDTENEQFGLWSKTEDDNAQYALEDDRSVFKKGLQPQETKTSHIQFKVSDEELNRLLTEKDVIDPNSGIVTSTYAEGYHEYLRTDNVWVDDEKVTAYEGVKPNDYETKNSKGEKYYIHRSINVDGTSGEWGIEFKLDSSRKISGIVFEDTPEEKSQDDPEYKPEDENVYKGNGKLDIDENVRAENVKVELLQMLNNQMVPAVLYQVDDQGNVKEIKDYEIKTNEKGEYVFDGVVPGYYYLRFTYGDGSQKMIIPGNSEFKSIILSKDYKSTIITGAVAEADKAKTDEDKLKLAEWYTKLNNDEKYSTAVGDRDATKYTFGNDGKVYIKDENDQLVEVNNYDALEKNSYTPLFGIKIENTEGNKSLAKEIYYEGATPKEFNQFNFGLIKEQSTPTIPEKKIANIKFTNQVGTTLVSDNPADSKSKLLSAVEKLDNKSGSKDAKLEVEDDMIYGSTLEVTYTIDILNNTKIEYNTEEFYKYGTIPKLADGSVDEEKMKKITVEEVEDTIDEKFEFNSAKVTSTNAAQTDIKPTTEKITDEEGNEITKKYWSITGWKSIKSGETASVSYTATALIATDALDTSYENKAKIKTISLDAFTSLNSESFKEWKEVGTEMTIVPPTGENRNVTYYIVGAIALVVLVGGIVLIKKKVM